jgi:arsenate reductase
MAEAFLRIYGGEDYQAYSAGMEPKDIHPFTYRVMDELGISIANQRPKSFREYLGKIHFGYLITVCDIAEKDCPTTFPSVGLRIHWSFEDPATIEADDETKLEKFREIRDAIRERIKMWLAEQEKINQ